MTHVFPQKKIVQAACTQVVEDLSEYLADDFRVKAMLLQGHVELGQEGQ